MVRKCPPGVFCFENVSLLFIIIIVAGVLYFIHSRGGFGHGHGHGYGHHASSASAIYMPVMQQQPSSPADFLDFGAGGPSSNQDVLMNPYVPPLRDNTTGSTMPIYDMRGGIGGGVVGLGGGGVVGLGGGGGAGTMHYGGLGMRVNVPTQSVDTTYRQVGILTRNGGNQETILPLIGRPLFSNRDKWQFYTLSDKNNAIKLPVTVNGRSGTGEYGCNNVSSGDTVFVEGYNDAFKVTAYDSASLRYLPF